MVLDIVLSIISSALVLMIISFLYKDNFWFRLATNIYVAGSLGYLVATNLKNLYSLGIIPFVTGKYWYLLVLIGCAMMFTRFMVRYSWCVRLPTSALIGVGIGVNMAAGVSAQIIAQVTDTFKPLITPSFTTSINNFLIIAGVCSVIMFFFYSKETKGTMGVINKVGRYFLMVALGSSFAYALLGRTSLLLERLKSLLVHPNYYLIFVAAVVILYDALKYRKR